MKDEILNVINEIRPFLMNDGGNIEFVKLQDDIVYVTLQGACQGCQMQSFTLKDGIERIMKERIPQIKEVKIYEGE